MLIPHIENSTPLMLRLGCTIILSKNIYFEKKEMEKSIKDDLYTEAIYILLRKMYKLRVHIRFCLKGLISS